MGLRAVWYLKNLNIGDWSLKNLNNMADSSEKVSFRVDMQCSSLRAEAFLEFDRGPHATLGQQIADMLPTACRPTVSQLLADSRLTVYQQSADSFLGELFFIFSQIWVVTRHQYGISALVYETSFGGETSG